MSEYLFGVATLPAIALTVFALTVAYVWTQAFLERRWGITWEAKARRDVDGISDYTLRNHIWWERSFGPFFAGGWYREPERYEQPTHRLINRWVGIGSVHGPCFTVFRSRDLGEVPA